MYNLLIKPTTLILQILHTLICYLEYEGGIFTYTRNQ